MNNKTGGILEFIGESNINMNEKSVLTKKDFNSFLKETFNKKPTAEISIPKYFITHVKIDGKKAEVVVYCKSFKIKSIKFI